MSTTTDKTYFSLFRDGRLGGTLTNPQRWNGYAYALNNSLRFVDPMGTWSADGNPCPGGNSDGCYDTSEYFCWVNYGCYAGGSYLQRAAEANWVAEQDRYWGLVSNGFVDDGQGTLSYAVDGSFSVAPSVTINPHLDAEETLTASVEVVASLGLINDNWQHLSSMEQETIQKVKELHVAPQGSRTEIYSTNVFQVAYDYLTDSGVNDVVFASVIAHEGYHARDRDSRRPYAVDPKLGVDPKWERDANQFAVFVGAKLGLTSDQQTHLLSQFPSRTPR